MSIADKLEKLETDITNVYSAIDAKRGTIPQNKNTNNLVDAINSISNIYEYSTISEMNSDTKSQEGDKAIIYREEIQPINENSEIDSCIFPNTVVLSEAFTDSIYGSFGSTGGGFFDGMVNMSGTSFSFNGFGDTMVRVQYTSNDGITYTRTDGGEELQEFGTTIKWQQYEPWDDVIGNFMKIVGNAFDGLYEYGPFVRNMVAFNWGNIDTSTSPYVTITNTNVKVKIDILDTCCLAISKYLLR